MTIQDITIIGAGAAGCFCGALCGESNPALKIRLLEKTRQPLSKVKISGGGRCNVTHHCFDIPFLIEHYPRGKDFLQAAFFQFQPKTMIEWLSNKGVTLKAETDGRMFPITNRSQTIIDCFLSILEKQKATVSLESEVISIRHIEGIFHLELKTGEIVLSKKVLFATGGVQKTYALLESLGHLIIPPIPSLFTFEVQEEWLKALSGSVASSAKIFLEGFPKKITGPVLVTHWGLSGPATLKLSAFAARWLFDRKYQATVFVNWIGESDITVKETLFETRKIFVSKKIALTPLFSLSKNLWKALVLQASQELENKTWAQVSKQEIEKLFWQLTQTKFTLVGKSLNKEEFVTSGGVDLDEVHPKTLESKKVPGLYFAGEVLNIDGVTGGFNFQNAWTTAYLAAKSMTFH